MQSYMVSSGCQLLDHHVRQTVKFGGKSVMVWGAISYTGVGKLVFIDTRMTAEDYIDILNTGYAETLSMHGLDFESSILQQDNDPKHLARCTKRWLLEHNIRLLKWPSCSPDLNIIEHVWFYLKSRISSSPVKPKNILELKSLITEIWNSIPVAYIQSLYNSIGERLEAVVRSKGGYTRF